jgi:hypothetical protein
VTHRLSEEALRIVQSFKTDVHNQLIVYREMQIDLIRYHFPDMSKEDQARAIDTIIRLQEHKYEKLV